MSTNLFIIFYIGRGFISSLGKLIKESQGRTSRAEFEAEMTDECCLLAYSQVHS